MGKIYCLMGKSASGKDTIYNKLLEDNKAGLKCVVLYTTRPVRTGEIDGETYFFCNEDKVSEFERDGKIIELRAYNTVHGIWKYFTADDGQIDLANADYLMIGTLEAYVKIREYFGAENVCPLYVWVDDGLRLERALARERAQSEPKYAELCRRFLADAEDFSEDKLAAAGVERRFENITIEQTVADIWDYIADNM